MYRMATRGLIRVSRKGGWREVEDGCPLQAYGRGQGGKKLWFIGIQDPRVIPTGRFLWGAEDKLETEAPSERKCGRQGHLSKESRFTCSPVTLSPAHTRNEQQRPHVAVGPSLRASRGPKKLGDQRGIHPM